jgi:antitoxin component YwqK of YwqJK toxin-antitoxin module
MLVFQLAVAQSDGPGIDFRDQAFASNTHPEYRSPVNISDGSSAVFSNRNRKQLIIKDRTTSGAIKQHSGTIVGFTNAGDTQFIAHYKRNKLRGSWISRFQADRLCDSGRLVNNIPDGLWKSWYENGNLRFIRNYDASRLQKAKQDIRLRQSKAVTSAIAGIARKNVSAAYSYLHPDYSFHTLAFHPESYSQNSWATLNDLVGNNTAEGSSVYEPPFDECLHHGLYMNFYPDGSVKDSGYYKNGLREGIWEEWLDDGRIRSLGFYSHGHKKDTWKFYNKKGVLLYIENYGNSNKILRRKEEVPTRRFN